MMLQRTLVVSLSLFAATGCEFFEAAFSPSFAPCESDENCPQEFSCVSNPLAFVPGDVQYDPGGKYCTSTQVKVLSNDEGVAALRAETSVPQDLIIEGTFGDVDLPNLVEIGGSLLVVPGTTMTSLSLPSLKNVGSGRTEASIETRPGFGVYIADTTVASIAMPELAFVGSNFTIARVSGLQVLELPSLGSIGSQGDLLTDAAGNVIAETFDLESLRACSIRFEDNPDLQVLSLPGLRGTTSHVVIAGNSQLDTLGLHRWEGYDRGGDEFYLREQSWLTVRNNPRLTALDLVEMQYAERLQIEDNDALETIDLTALKGVYGTLSIRRNLALTTIDIDPDLAEDFSGGFQVSDSPLMSCADLDLIADAFSPAYVEFENLQGVCAPRTPIVRGRAQPGACIEAGPTVDADAIYLDTLDGADATFDESWDACFDADDTNVDVFWRLPERPVGTVWTATLLNLSPFDEELVQLTFITAPGCVAATATCLESSIETETDVEHTVEDGEGPLFLVADGRLFDLDSADIVRDIAVSITETAP